MTLVVLDTLRADFLSDARLLDQLPTLRRLLSESVLFTRAYAPSFWTLPSHASLFTGLLPSQHQAFPPHMHLRTDVPTVAEAFRSRGYRCVAVSCNPFISELFGTARGFDATELVAEVNAPGLLDPLLSRRGWDGPVARSFRDMSDGLIGLVYSDPRKDNGARAALALVRGQNLAGGDPTFLFVNLMEAHSPYRARGRYRFWTERLRFPRIFGRYEELVLETFSGRRRITGREAGALREIYWANVSYLDAQLGLLLKALPPGCLEDGWLVVLSDHGEMLGEKGELHHIANLWEELIHVPLLIRPPGGIAPERIDIPVGTARLYFFLNALAEGQPDPLRIWLESVRTPGYAIAEAHGHIVPYVKQIRRRGRRKDPLWERDILAFHRLSDRPALACVARGWKLICRLGEGDDELYDLARTTGEAENMQGQHPDVEKEMHERLRRRYLGAEDSGPAGAPTEPRRDELPLEAKAAISQTVLTQAMGTDRRPALLWTAGKDSTLVLFLTLAAARRERIAVPPVVLVDHGQHFPETWALVREVVAQERLELVIARNENLLAVSKPGVDTVPLEALDAENQEEALKVGLEGTRVPLSLNTQVGNHMMKTVALNRTLFSRFFDYVITGIRWDENPARSSEVFISPREDTTLIRVHPILPWTERDVWTYTLREKLPIHPLYAKGYRSLDGIHDSSPTDTRPAWEQDLEGTKERAGRAQDKEHIMERLRALGYF